jgi:CRP-like cAMP-binding protein
VTPREASATVHELSKIGLFAELPGERLAKLASRMTREYVPAGQEIVREGEFGGRFYIVLEGMLTVTQEARGERRVLRPGDYFGEVAPAMGIRRTATVRAVTPATVASCERVTFDEFVRPLFID